MSGIWRRGSLKLDCNLSDTNKITHNARGSMDSNLEGGYREPTTPVISVIGLDLRRYSEELRKDDARPSTEGSSGFKRDLSQDIDSDIISNYIGHYRLWSFFWTFLLCLFQLPTTFHMFMFVFQTADKNYWCARPEHLMHANLSEWVNNITRFDPTNCAILDLDYSSIQYENDTWLNLPSDLIEYVNYTHCPSIEFDGVGIGDRDGDGDGGEGVNGDKTLVQEFNLICKRRNLRSVVEMCFLAGAAIGSVASGWISDRFGRRHTLMAFATIQTTFGGLLAFSTSLTMYMTLRVIIGFASMTVTIVSFVLVVELVSGKWRTIIGILNILPVSLSYVLAAGIAFNVRDWRQLQLVISLPWLALLCIWYWLPESPRWLLAHGRLDELYNVIERAAKMNRSPLPSNYRKTLEAAVPNSMKRTERTRASTHSSTGDITMNNNNNVATDATNVAAPTVAAPTITEYDASVIDVNSNPLLVVFNHTYWRTTCLTLIVWLTLIIIYFGLTLHLSNLGGNIYLNSAIAGAIEAISICASIFVVLKIGIKRSLVIFMALSGVCCLATNIAPQGKKHIVIYIAMIAKCLIGANNAIIPTYTAMQYPTIIRNFGVGMGNLAAGIALILVPYLWLLEHYEELLPLSIMGVCGIVGAIALALMKNVE